MNPPIFPKLAFMSLVVLQFLACAEKKEYVPSEAAIMDRVNLERRHEESIYREMYRNFETNEKNLGNSLKGGAVPESIREEYLDKVNYIPLDLEFIDVYSTYIQMVDSLSINCNGTVEYAQIQRNYKISQESFLTQEKWVAKKLLICGHIELPQGQKLMIYGQNETVVQDFSLKLNKNTFFSLEAHGFKYAGKDPNFDLNHKSIIKLNLNNK